MYDLYGVLGVAPGADQAAIKAAFRDRAKRWHPDVNAGDVAAEQRFKEINRAYRILSDPAARATHERALTGQRHGRRWPSGAIALATFLLTVALVPLAAFWAHRTTTARPHAGVAVSAIVAEPSHAPALHVAMPTATISAEARDAPAPSLIGHAVDASHAVHGGPPFSQPAPEQGAQSARPESPPRADAAAPTHKWRAHSNTRLGFVLRYPGEVFAEAAPPAPADSPVRTFASRDGRATLQIVAGPIATGVTIAKYRRAVMEQRYGGATYDYAPQNSHWFVLSGTRREEMFYERVTFACDGRSMHGWQLTYPVAERALYDRIVEQMHGSYRHSNGPGARCEGKREPTPAAKPLATIGPAAPAQVQ